LLLRDNEPALAYNRWCTVQQQFAAAKLHDNGKAWLLTGPPRTRPIRPDAQLHASVQVRRQQDPRYLPKLENAELPARWADLDWLNPVSFGEPAATPSTTPPTTQEGTTPADVTPGPPADEAPLDTTAALN
jgi:hypothetical protein